MVRTKMTKARIAASAVLVSLTAPGYSEVVAGSDVYRGDTTSPRRLTGCSRTDDALDPVKPSERPQVAFDSRVAAAELERDGTGTVCQFNSGDTDPAALFHKSLPHDELGQVDEEALAALDYCILSGDFDICEAVPAGENAGFPTGSLVNPLAGVSIDMAGPSSMALTLPPVPTLNSAGLAAQMAETYWMAVTRDVPFSQYGTDELTITAAANLAAMESFSEQNGVAIGDDGTVDPASQLFRSNFYGVETGPFMSQLLLNDVLFDCLTTVAQQETFAPGIDYMTSVEDWLDVQNGVPPTETEELDSVPRFIRNSRDLSKLVFADTINTEAFRGAFILIENLAFSRAGANGPYTTETRQAGFVNFGASHYIRLLGTAELAQRSSWYQKWQVHRVVRPEALAGTIHFTLTGQLDAPINPSLLENTVLLDVVAATNAANNNGTETFLLPQASRGGSPTHPSYPSGHATQNGAYATILKALVGLERGAECFPDPMIPDDEGLELLNFRGDCLTFEGEINKLAVNVAIGRSILGVHYRIDSIEGLLLGETHAVRLLHQEVMTFAENFPFEFRLFTGEIVKLNPDGSFSVDGVTCEGLVFTGAEDCR